MDRHTSTRGEKEGRQGQEKEDKYNHKNRERVKEGREKNREGREKSAVFQKEISKTGKSKPHEEKRWRRVQVHLSGTVRIREIKKMLNACSVSGKRQ